MTQCTSIHSGFQSGAALGPRSPHAHPRERENIMVFTRTRSHSVRCPSSLLSGFSFPHSANSRVHLIIHSFTQPTHILNKSHD